MRGIIVILLSIVNHFLFLDGHALSKKLAKQVKKCTNKLKEMLTKYNSSRDSLSDDKRSFKQLQVSDMIIATEEVIQYTENEADAVAQIPYSIRRQAIDMLHLLRRNKEEIVLVEKEMRRVFEYYQKEESNLSNTINQHSSNSIISSHTMGSISLLKSKQKALQHRLLTIYSSLKSYVSLPTLEFSQSLQTIDSNFTEDYNDAGESSTDEAMTDDSDNA